MSRSGPETTREERKVVTAIFADLVGSTALAERLDPEEAKLVLGDAIARIIATVEAFGGTVKDLAGDGVLALFGAPASHEDDPERAVRAALRVEYGAVGDAVNTAARLQAAASAGSVLVSAATQRLIESSFTWSDPRELTLKGKSATVSAYEVAGARADGRTRESLSVQARLVGRDRELEMGRAAVGAALAGAGGVLFITGEAGIGKTRLLAELREEFESGRAVRGGQRWVEGRCISYGESLQYWPFRDLVRNWLAITVDEPELRVRVALRRELERFLPGSSLEMYPYLGAMLGLSLEPEASARLAELAPEALQYRTFEVVRTLAARLAQEGPLALVLEDLHWADPTSIQLTEALLPLTEDVPVLIVVSARSERDHPSWRLKELASREYPHATVEIALDVLSDEADRNLLRDLVAPASLPPPLEQGILARAEGNPLYLEELVRSLIPGRGSSHSREGHLDAHRPASRGSQGGPEGRLGPRPAVRAPSPRSRSRNRRQPSKDPARPAADGPLARGTAMAGARLPLQARPDPGSGLPNDRRRGAQTPAPGGCRVVGAAVRRPRGRGGRPPRPPLERRR